MNAFSAVLFTEGRVVWLCWANQNLKDLNDVRLCWELEEPVPKHSGALLSLGNVDPLWAPTPQIACII